MKERRSSQHWASQQRKRVLLVLVAVIGNLILLKYVYFGLFEVAPADYWLQKIRRENSFRHRTYYEIENQFRTVANPSWSHHAEVLAIYKQLVDHYTPDNILLNEVSERCRNENEFFWIHDVQCRAWWMAVLTKEEVVDVGIMLGFPPSEHKLGALQLIFRNGLKAWYKPCGLFSEYPENEVIASGIDFLADWKRTPPAVMRNFTVAHLNRVLKKTSWLYPLSERHSVIDQTSKICSENGQFRGAFIGWWTGLKDGVSLPKTGPFFRRYKSKSDMRTERLKLPDSVNAEEVHIHILLYLLNINRKPGKNEFVYDLPPKSPNEEKRVFMAIDLDRANLTRPATDEPTFCTGCKFGNQTVQIINNVLEDELWFREELKSLLHTLGGFFLTDAQVAGLLSRLRSVQGCINSCIKTYGRSEVIIPDAIWVN